MIDSNEALCDTAIAQLIQACDLPQNLGEEPLFKVMIASARMVSKEYEPPKIMTVGGTLLAANYRKVREINDGMIAKNSSSYGLQAMGDGATIKKMPLLNVLVSRYDTAPVILAVHDCSKHLARGRVVDTR